MSKIKNRHTSEVIYFGDEALVDLAIKNKANLCEADLYGANLHGANLYVANLYGADLRKANLRGANLRGANLRGANLREANLYGADLCEADLRRADLYGADLYVAKYADEILLKHYTITRIGSRNDTLQVFITETNVILKTGCFTGSINDLASKLKNTSEHEEYRIAITGIDAMVELVRRKK